MNRAKEREKQNKTKQKKACFSLLKAELEGLQAAGVKRSAAEGQGHCTAQAPIPRTPHFQPIRPPKPSGIFRALMAHTRHEDVLKAQPIFMFFPLPLDVIYVFRSYKTNAFFLFLN